MTTTDYLIFMAPFVATVLIVFGMKYLSALFQARARAADEASYRALTEKALAIQSESQATLSAVRADLARLAASLATVERILQQVE